MTWVNVMNDLAPFVAAQLYSFCLLYIIVTRKRLGEAFPYVTGFLVAVVVFLIAYQMTYLEWEIHLAHLLHFRLAILLGVGFPSVSLAVLVLSGRKVQRWQAIVCYGVAATIVCMAIFFNCLAWRESFGDRELYFTGFFLEFKKGQFWSQLLCTSSAVLFVMIPCCGVAFGKNKQEAKNKAFLWSFFVFALLFVFGIVFQFWAVYYVGACVTAVIFAVGVYLEIYYLHQTASFVKEELRVLVSQGGENERLAELVQSLESFSKENLEVYKMRIREVLSGITEDAIASGANVESLMARNQANLSKIEQAQDVNTLSEVTQAEAANLAEIIVNVPNERRKEVVEKAKDYIHNHLAEELTIQHLTDQLCVSRSYLTGGFKEIEGMTVNQFVNQQRVAQGKIYLADQTITEAAYNVGFNNSNYFSTVFKKLTGISPKEYQDRLEYIKNEGFNHK